MSYGTLGSPITVIPNGDGTYSEPGSDAAWTRTEYTEPREACDDCAVCGEPVEEWGLWVCLDGGEAAHTGCVRVEEREQS